jgi:gamma-glutamyl:cysteine ligase YbdK (ATP-grasp superfamily)
VLDIAAELMQACRPHATTLGCSGELELLCDVLDHPGPAHQRALAARSGLDGLAAQFALEFDAPLTALVPDAA